MSVFEFDTEGATAVADEAHANTLPVEDLRPGFSKGIPTAVGYGVMRGFAKTADTLLTAATALDQRPVMSGYRGTNRLVPAVAQGVAIRTPEEVEKQQRDQDDLRKQAIDYWTPHANDVGTAGRVLGGLSEIAGPLMLGGGNPAMLMGTTAIQSGKDLVNEGVDAETAATVGTAEALATGIGFKLPFLGKTLASRMATGAAGNLALGTVLTEADKLLLESKGYAQQAEQFDPFNAEARMVDLLTGLAFGGIAHITAPSVRDAALTASNAKHFQQDTAPGIPADIPSSVAHQSAMEAAIKDLEAGDPVRAHDMQEAAFLRKDMRNVLHPEVEGVARELDLPKEDVKSESVEESDAYSVREGEMTDEQAKAFQGLRSRLQADKVVGGPREAAPREQGRADDGGQREETSPLVVFRGSEQPLTAEHFNAEALGKASGHPSSGLGVFFTNDRGDAARYGSLVEESHLDIRNPKVIKFENLPGFDTMEEATRFREKLRAQGHDGIVLDASHYDGPVQYVAFDQHQVIPRKQKTKASAEPASIKIPEHSLEPRVNVDHDLAIAKPASIEAAAAEQVLAAKDLQIPTGEIDAEGAPKTISARELMEQARQDVKTAKKDAKMFDAAVTCFLSAS